MRAFLRHATAAAPCSPPVVILSIVAVAMAAFAFVATRDSGAPEREITPAARSTAAPSPSATPSASPSATAPEEASRCSAPRSTSAFNNSAIKGLAAGTRGLRRRSRRRPSSRQLGGTAPSPPPRSHPPRFPRAAKLLAADLGVRRTAPAVDPMRMDRLTLILNLPLPQR